MICSNCIKKDVCKHKEYLDMYSGLELNKCEYKKVEGMQPSTLSNISVSHFEKPKQPRLSREEVNEKILELSKQQNEPPTLREMITCEICGAVDFKDQMHKCSKCGNWVCSSCSLELPTIGVDPNKPMETEFLCDNCWSQEQQEQEPDIEIVEEDNDSNDE